MSTHFVITNKGEKPLHVQAMSRDAMGRFVHAYLIQVEGGHSKSFSSELPNASFSVTEVAPDHAILLPRGVPPANVEKPNEVKPDPAVSAEVAQVADVPNPEEKPAA